MLTVVQVKSLLGNLKVSDEEIKESIYHYDFDVDRVVKYFVDKEEKKKKKLAQEKAKAKAVVPVETTGTLKSESKLKNLVSQKSENKGLDQPESKLAALVRARASGNGSGSGKISSSLTSVGLLNKISTGKPTLSDTITTNNSQSPKRLSAFSSLASLGTPSKGSLSKLGSGTGIGLGKGVRSSRSGLVDSSTINSTSNAASTTSSTTTASSLLESKTKPPPQKKIKCFPNIDLDILNLLPAQSSPPSPFGMVFGVSRNSIYKATGVSNTPLALDSNFREGVIEAFNNPSPDDIVLSAQEQGFSNLEKKVVNLKLNEEGVQSKSQSPIPLKININNELIQNKKPSLNFVVIGHVDAGKSTLMGRLLYDVDAVDKHTIDKYTKESGNIGKGSFALAWVMDQTEEERNRGVTIDICISTFNTKQVQFTIVDAPGHRDFVPNMIAGSSQADVAVLVVDSATNAFESGFNLDGQTKEHAILVRSLGVDRIVVVVNKLDTVDWSFERYEEIRIQLTEFLTKIVGFQLQKITFIPASGLNGDNVVTAKKDLPWYTGNTVLSQLEKIAIEEKPVSQKKDHDKDFRMIISDSYNIPHSSDIAIQGRIDSGSVQFGQSMKIIPSGIVTQVKSISTNGEGTTSSLPSKQDWAIAGDNIILNVSGTNLLLDQINVGDVLVNESSHIESIHKFTSRIVVFDLKRPILPGNKMLLHRGRINEPCKITKLISTLDKATGHEIKKKPRFLASGQTATIEVELEGVKTIPMDTFTNSKELGRFVLRKEGSTIAAGVVDSLTLPSPPLPSPES